MFDSIFGTQCRTGGGDVANAYQDPRFIPKEVQEKLELHRQVQDIQKIVDALCKVYVAAHAKDIEERSHVDKYFQTDQPIIDRANMLDLQRKIKIAEMELSELKRGRGL